MKLSRFIEHFDSDTIITIQPNTNEKVYLAVNHKISELPKGISRNYHVDKAIVNENVLYVLVSE